MSGPKVIYRIGPDEYIGWSSICGAPASAIHTREQAVEAWGEDRIERCDTPARSSALYEQGKTFEPSDHVGFNRAGPHETLLTLDEIRTRYAPDFREDENGPWRRAWEARRRFQDAARDVRDEAPFSAATLHAVLTSFVGSPSVPEGSADA